MTSHLYVRAYLAGIGVPTVFLLVALSAFLVLHFGGSPVPIERLLVFPMAVVPNLWGVWNVLYAALRRRHPWPLGLHGAALTLVLLPAGIALTNLLEIPIPIRVATLFPVAVAVYYLAWKHVVGFLNRLLEVEPS